MFDKTYEDRLLAWSKFRQSLESSLDPIQDVIDKYNTAPTVSIHTDPWDQSTWPDPWQLLIENQYCEFARVLGMCYSLQLTDCFNESKFEIHIAIDYKKSTSYYFLVVDKYVIGYYNSYNDIEELPDSVVAQKIYNMPHRQ